MQNIRETLMTGASYYIAEVGQNHQGDLQTALDYVRIFADVGANALKFQARSNKVLFDEKSYNAIYNSENAFGDTYGEHREFLELSKSQLIMIRDECHKHNTHFMCTPFDEESLSMLVDINVDIFNYTYINYYNKGITNFSNFEKREYDYGLVVSDFSRKIKNINKSIQYLKKRRTTRWYLREQK